MNWEIINISTHYVGNKTKEEGVILCKKTVLKEDIKKYLTEYFLSSFNFDLLCSLFHEADGENIQKYCETSLHP